MLSMRTVVVAFLFLIKVRYCRYLPNKLDADNGAKFENVHEIQHAVCKVATEEIQATANASITRQLKGVCSTKAMNARIDELQKKMMTEIEVFKLMLISAGYTTPRPDVSLPVEAKSSDTYDDYDYIYYYDNQTHLNDFKSLEYSNNTQTMKDNYNKTANVHYNTDVKVNKVKMFNSLEQSAIISERFPREHEVKENNETIKDTNMGRAFVYYWRIPDFQDLVKDDLEIMSPLIEYLGNTMFMKLSTKHLGTNYISLELLTPNRFWKPFKFVIMHREVKSDFNSPLLENTKPSFAIFRLAKDKIESFINSGALLIKLLLYIGV